MRILETVRQQRAQQRHARRSTGIGADLIPRGSFDDTRYADVDLDARGNDLDALQLGLDRVSDALVTLSSESRETASRIGKELREAGPEEIGCFATDVLYAYSDVGRLSLETEATMYLAWALGLGLEDRIRVRDKRERRGNVSPSRAGVF